MKNRILKQQLKKLKPFYSLFIFFILLTSWQQAYPAKTTVTGLTVNYAENPMGINPEVISFGWKMESNLVGQAQVASQIKLSEENGQLIWDSGVLNSDLSVGIPYKGPALKLETRYKWIAIVTCKTGEIVKSNPAFFETGSDFKNAAWIFYKPSVNNCFRNSIQINVTPTILKNGFTLCFGIKNEQNQFAWSFTENSLVATKNNVTGNAELAKVDLTGVIAANQPFDLSVNITSNTIVTTINGKQVSLVNHSYAIERPYVGVQVSGEQMNWRTREVTKPSQSAQFSNLKLSVDGSSESVGESSFTLTPPVRDPSTRPSFGPPQGAQGVSYIQKEFQGKPVEFIPESTTMPLFRTEKPLKGTVKSARLYITSLGVFDAFINGQEVKQIKADGTVMDDIFSPGWTNYLDYMYYRTYDVTSYLNAKSVALAARIGNGWYGGLIGREYYGNIGEKGINELAFIAQMVITYTDGTQQVIATNTEDWKASDEGPIVSNDFFIGEVYDARFEAKVKNWNKVGFNDSSWNPVSKLDFSTRLIGGDENTAYLSEYLLIKPKATKDTYIYDPEKVNFTSGLKFGEIVPEQVDPAKEIKLAKGKKFMIDLEQNIAGLAGISVSGKTGTRITMRGAEMLNDGKNNPKVEKGGSCGPKGTLYWTGLSRGRSSEDNWYTDVYYMNDEPVQNYRASFTSHGFRYLEIYADNDIVLHKVYAQPITSIQKQTGKIKTNNENVNQLFSNILWSQMGNHITIPTDCPNRSERLGWSGDIVVFGETALYNFDVVNFMNNYMDISANYAKNNGRHLGTTMPGMNSGQGSTNAGWTDVGIILAWSLYQQTGDISILEKNYSLLSNYMNKLIKDGLKPGYGDWVALQATSATYMAGAYQMYDAFLMNKIASVLGHSDDAAKFSDEYERMKKVLTDKYVDAQGNLLSVSADKVQRGGFLQPDILLDNSQTSILWALKLGLNKSADEKNVFINNLLKNIDNEGGKERSNATEKTLSTGFLGINVFLPTLSENGLNNSAYDLLLQDKMPSWLYEVKNNATTTWERWNAYSNETSFEDNGMNSFNHYAYGAVGEWMFEYMAGIQKDETKPGFKNIILQPTPDNGKAYNDQARINQVDGSYDSYYGTIVSNWKSDGNNLKSYETVIPANTTATLYLPVGQLSADKLDKAFKNTPGTTYKGITQRNGLNVAEVHLLAGGYRFELNEEKITSSLLNGYKAQ